MYYSYFISSRLTKYSKGKFTTLAHKIGVSTIALGVVSMLVFSLSLKGMQKAIKNKIFSLSGHVHIRKFSFSKDIEEYPIYQNDIKDISLENIENISKYYPFLHKMGLIKFKGETEGVVFKGLNFKDYKYDHIKPFIVEGRFLSGKDEYNILLGKKLSKKLKIKLGDNIISYFIQDPPRLRKLKVVGIYNTNIPDIDEKLIFCPLKTIQKLNSWSEEMVGGFEIILKNINQIDNSTTKISNKMKYGLKCQNVKSEYSSIFDWLIILDKNKSILFILILIVACANIASITIIQMIERTYMIGVLKTLGAKNSTIINIIFIGVIDMLTRGLLWGNLIGIGLCAIQYFFKIVKLDPDGIYIEHAMIDWDILSIIYINVITISIISIIMLFFINIIVLLRPIRMIKFI